MPSRDGWATLYPQPSSHGPTRIRGLSVGRFLLMEQIMSVSDEQPDLPTAHRSTLSWGITMRYRYGSLESVVERGEPCLCITLALLPLAFIA